MNKLCRIFSLLAVFAILVGTAQAYEYFGYAQGNGVQTTGSVIDLYTPNYGLTVGYPAISGVILFGPSGAGTGYMELTVNTDAPVGWYNVGYVWDTGLDIMVQLY